MTLSKTQDSCSELSEMGMGPAKMSRKRARPGENCRPRPRDRQLIQDRIKELRDIVPNGSKVALPLLDLSYGFHAASFTCILVSPWISYHVNVLKMRK